MITKDSEIKEILGNDTLQKLQGINGNFQKLEKWTIEKYAASGVLIKDFAELGKISSNDLLKHVEKFGFEVKFDDSFSNNDKAEEVIDEGKLNIVTLDVRPMIAEGNDPFAVIMQAIAKLGEDETLKIINVFVPVPLVNVLKGKGFRSWTNTIRNNEYHTFFTKSNVELESNPVSRKEETKGDFDAKLASFGDKIREIDVRSLEMPEPMVTILSELETLPKDHVLLVNHKKVPQFLLPELKTRNYQWMHKDVEDGFILFIVFK